MEKLKHFDFDYDPENDSLLVHSKEEKSRGSVELGNLIFDYNPKKEFVGLEILDDALSAGSVQGRLDGFDLGLEDGDRVGDRREGFKANDVSIAFFLNGSDSSVGGAINFARPCLDLLNDSAAFLHRPHIRYRDGDLIQYLLDVPVDGIAPDLTRIFF